MFLKSSAQLGAPTDDIDVTIGIFGCPPRIVQSEPQILKTWKLSSKFEFLEETNSWISWEIEIHNS